MLILELRASPRESNIFFQKTWSFITLKNVLGEKRRPSPILKYIRQFYIRNPILFLNYFNHFYIFFLSCTFALGILSYSLFFLRPSTFRLTDKHAREKKIRVTQKHVTLRETGWLFPSSKRLVDGLEVVGEGFFLILLKTQD